MLNPLSGVLQQRGRLADTLPYLAPALVATLIAAVFNLDLPNLWFDEAAQFWISQGGTPYSPPVQPLGTFGDVIRVNSTFNLDPGGFGILLRYWGAVSQYHIWLRVLPLFFFVLTVLLFFRLGRFWSSDLRLAAAMSLVPFFSGLLSAYAFEIRAFSMEYLGTALLVYACCDLNRRVGLIRVVGYGLALAFFITSRYSESVFIGVALPFMVFLIWRHRSGILSFVVRVFVLLVPVTLMLACIVIYAYRTQAFLLSGTHAPGYVRHMSGLDPTSMILLSVPALVFLGLFVMLRKRESVRKLFPLAYFLVAGNLAFGFLSVLGMHAWDPSVRWCISLNLLDYLAFGACLCLVPECWRVLTTRPEWKPSTDKLVQWAQAIGPRTQTGIAVAVLLLGMVVTCFGIINHELPFFGRLGYPPALDTTWPPMVDQVAYDLKRLNLTAQDKVYVALRESGTVRYLFEFGVFSKSGLRYPDNFYFDTVRRDTTEEIPNVESFDVFISDHWKLVDPRLGLKPVEPWKGIWVRQTRPVLNSR